MSTQIHDSSKAPSSDAATTLQPSQLHTRPFAYSEQSAFVPTANQFQSRPFAIQAKSTSPQQKTLDIQTQLEQAKHFGYDLANIPVFTSGTPSPASPSSSITQPTVQRKCSACQEEDSQLRRKQESSTKPENLKANVSPIFQFSDRLLDSRDRIETLPENSSEGEEKEAVAFGKGIQLKLAGKTTAKYQPPAKAQINNLQKTPATGCKGCGPKNTCVNATGVFEATYKVTTKVTLPKVPKVPKLSECQKQAAQDFIDNVLAPHEQEHVDAFNQYNGTTQTPFDITVCENKVESTIQSMFKKEAAARKASAQAASNALDPFVAPIEGLDCEDS